MVDIEINAWSSLFLNLETNLILKSLKKSTTGKFEILRAIKDYYTETGGLSNFKKPVFDFSVPIRKGVN